MTAKHAKKFSKATYKPFAPLGLYYIAVFAAIHLSRRWRFGVYGRGYPI